jgi:hypothetical protein
MASVTGTPGRTSARVHADRLLRRSSGWVWLLPSVGVGAAAVIWGMGGTATPAVTIASFAAATLGIAWMLITSIPAVRRAGGRSAEIVEFASAVADVAIAAGLGGIAGLVIAQTGAIAVHGEAAAAGATAICVAVWWRWRASATKVALLRAGAQGEQEVASILDSLPDGFVVLHDIMLPAKSGHCELDHLVLGPTGVWVLETKRWGGTLTPGKDVWVQDGRYGRKTHLSPVAQLRRAQQAAADRLGLRADQIIPALVLARGALTGDAGVRIERPRTLRDAILRAPSSWPLAITPEQAARTLTT